MLKDGSQKVTIIIFDEGIILCLITQSQPIAWSHIATVRIPAPFWGVQKVFYFLCFRIKKHHLKVLTLPYVSLFQYRKFEGEGHSL